MWLMCVLKSHKSLVVYHTVWNHMNLLRVDAFYCRRMSVYFDIYYAKPNLWSESRHNIVQSVYMSKSKWLIQCEWSERERERESWALWRKRTDEESMFETDVAVIYVVTHWSQYVILLSLNFYSNELWKHWW